jgi:hypothetical protein
MVRSACRAPGHRLVKRIQIFADASLTRATYFRFDGNYMFPIVERFGTGHLTIDQVRRHYADPGKFNGYAWRGEAPTLQRFR